MTKLISKPLVKKGKATFLSQKIAEILMDLRQQHAMTQTGFAEFLGVSFQQYQKYEKGKDRISLEKAMVLCEKLDLSLNTFMGNSTSGFAETQQAGFGQEDMTPSKSLSKQERELLDMYSEMSFKSRKAFLEMGRSLVKVEL